MAFPEGFVEDVRRAADIVRVVSEHVSLKRMGTSWKGLCPFHKEKTPSFNVRAEPPLFHCFGCGEGGDVFKFLMLHERVSFPEAVETLARRFGVPVPAGRFEAGPDRKQREELLAAVEAATQHFERNLWTAPGTRVREYLLGRGFARTTLERIRAGAALDAWDALLGALRGRFSPAALAAAGLVLERQDKSGHYDRFRNRAIFPILDEAGRVVGFGARSLDGSEPKYLNSPETPIYQKSRLLYGLSWAKEAARREGRLILMEGYLDVARALEAGVEGAVATCGTALTESHARLLRRFAGRLYVNFDQDAAGRKAAERSFEALSEEGLEVRVVELPAGEDPDSFLKARGATTYAERLEAAPVALEWLIRRAAEEHDVASPPGKAAFLKALVPALRRVESAVERAAWIPRVVEAGRLDAAAARDELRRALVLGGERPAAPAPAAGTPARGAARPLDAERLLVAGLLREAEGWPEALLELEDAELQGLATAGVLRAARGCLMRGERASLAALEAALATDAERRQLRELALEEAAPEAADPRACVAALRRRTLEQRLAEVHDAIRRAAVGAEAAPELDRLLRQKNDLSREIAGL
jgi:DNA primase